MTAIMRHRPTIYLRTDKYFSNLNLNLVYLYHIFHHTIMLPMILNYKYQMDVLIDSNYQNYRTCYIPLLTLQLTP